jgi:hypothetical protein
VRASLLPHRGLVGDRDGAGFQVFLEYPGYTRIQTAESFPFVSANPAVFAANGTVGKCLTRGVAAISVALPDRTLATTATCFGPDDATALIIQSDDPVNVDAGQKVEFST